MAHVMQNGAGSWQGTDLGHPLLQLLWGFPKIRGTFLRIPIIRTIVYLDLYWGPPILGNYHR